MYYFTNTIKKYTKQINLNYQKFYIKNVYIYEIILNRYNLGWQYLSYKTYNVILEIIQ
jgi:hypothetical protein